MKPKNIKNKIYQKPAHTRVRTWEVLLNIQIYRFFIFSSSLIRI